MLQKSEPVERTDDVASLDRPPSPLAPQFSFFFCPLFTYLPRHQPLPVSKAKSGRPDFPRGYKMLEFR